MVHSRNGRDGRQVGLFYGFRISWADISQHGRQAGGTSLLNWQASRVQQGHLTRMGPPEVTRTLAL